MASQVILYDLPSQKGNAWNFNCWKTRLILNFKGVDYKTQWVEYPDIAPTWKEFGIPPNPKDAPGYFTDYSAPAIQYADGTHEQDSWPIAHQLEKIYPTPSLHLDDPIVLKIRDHIANLMMPLMAHFIPAVPSIMPKRSADYFNETRAKLFGAPLSEIAKTATEEGWENVVVAAKEAGDLLRKNSGPFFLGETVSYADFLLVSFLHMLKRLDEEKHDRFMALDSAFPKIYEASKQWLEKDE